MAALLAPEPTEGRYEVRPADGPGHPRRAARRRRAPRAEKATDRPRVRSVPSSTHSRREIAQGRISPLVFHLGGEPILLKRFYRQWRRAAKAAGIYRKSADPITGRTQRGPIPHDFRRKAVRNLEWAGVARSVAMKLAGHRTEAVYRRYAIVSEADLASGVERLAALPSGTAIRTADRHPAIALANW